MPDAQALTAAVGGLKIHADAFDRACVPCRKQKRKCDKLLPKCSLCKRLCRECSYDAPDNGNAGGMMPLARSAEIALFTPAAVRERINKQAAELLCGELGVRSCVTEYFETIHDSFPILEKEAYRDGLCRSWQQPRAEISLLLLCMLLLISKPSEHDGSRDLMSLYVLVKGAISQLDAVESASIGLLQCRLLVNLFEIGHGMLGTARITNSTNILTADILGVNDSLDLMVEDVDSWLAWRGVLIIDRFLCLESGRAASPTKLLGYIQRQPSCPKSSMERRIGVLAEASRLLEQALAHVYNPTTLQDFNITEALQLLRTLMSFKEVLALEEGNEGASFCSARGISNSAVLSVLGLSQHLKQNPSEFCTIYSRAFFNGLVEEIVNTARKLEEGMMLDKYQDISPFIFHCVYKTAVLLSSDADSDDAAGRDKTVMLLTNALRSASSRWLLARHYYQLLMESGRRSEST